jgi:hypothetical protein
MSNGISVTLIDAGLIGHGMGRFLPEPAIRSLDRLIDERHTGMRAGLVLRNGHRHKLKPSTTSWRHT